MPVFDEPDTSTADNALTTFIVTTPVDGLAVVVEAHSTTQAASLAPLSLQQRGVSDDVVRPLIEGGWPDASDIEEMDGHTPSAIVLTGDE